MLVFAAVAGGFLAKSGRYKPIHAVAFGVIAVTFGLFTLLDRSTPKVEWAFFELIGSFGTGLTLSTLLPAIMAPLKDSDTAVASATYSFTRSFVSSIRSYYVSILHLIPEPSIVVQSLTVVDNRDTSGASQ